MRLRFRVGTWGVYVAVNRLYEVKGVNSRVGPGKHILLWDFDKQPYDEVMASLAATQSHWGLGPIVVLRSSPDSYHAYCFSARPFLETAAILATTRGVDPVFFRLGTTRGYWTLRYSDKHQGQIERIGYIASRAAWDIDPLQHGNLCRYQTTKG